MGGAGKARLIIGALLTNILRTESVMLTYHLLKTKVLRNDNSYERVLSFISHPHHQKDLLKKIIINHKIL